MTWLLICAVLVLLLARAAVRLAEVRAAAPVQRHAAPPPLWVDVAEQWPTPSPSTSTERTER